MTGRDVAPARTSRGRGMRVDQHGRSSRRTAREERPRPGVIPRGASQSTEGHKASGRQGVVDAQTYPAMDR